MFSMGELITTLECRKTTRVTALEVDQLEVEPTLSDRDKSGPKGRYRVGTRRNGQIVELIWR